MNKKNIILMIIITLFIFTGKVNAEEASDGTTSENVTCSAKRLTELRKQASYVKVTYVPVELDENLAEPDPENGITSVKQNYIYVKIYNMTSQMWAQVHADGASGSFDHKFYFENMGVDGTFTIKHHPTNQNVVYEVDIYGYALNGECMNTKLRTLKITVPKFNFYSQVEACQDIPDYYLCAPYTTYDIDGNTFYDKVNEYKAKLESQEIIGDEENNSGIVTQTISTISKYKYIIVGVIVAVGVAVSVIIIRRKKDNI